MKVKECPICKYDELRRTYKDKLASSNYMRCCNCGLVFQNPIEDKEKTATRYQEGYFQYELANQENFLGLIVKTMEDFDLLRHLPPRSKVLEIGSATGLFLQYMDSLGHKSTGVDLCKESVDYGKEQHKVDLRHGRLEDMRFRKETFDFIHFAHLIEHLNDPVAFLEKVYSLLVPGGVIMVTTPNTKGIFAKYYMEDWRSAIDDHLYLFNVDNLKFLLEKVGFKIKGYKTWGSIPVGFKYPKIKVFTDKLVKKYGLGDVMAFYCTK